MKLFYTERAKADLETAFLWYKRQRRGLGFEFLDCVEMAVRSISEHPNMYRVRHQNIRSCVIRRFPFSIFHSLEAEKIIVHSIFDNRQDPDKRP
jgi:plasmid stabilization system protein ParE